MQINKTFVPLNQLKNTETNTKQMKKYIIKLKHDRGHTILTTMATSQEVAKENIMKAEGCPESAIISIREAIITRP